MFSASSTNAAGRAHSVPRTPSSAFRRGGALLTSPVLMDQSVQQHINSTPHLSRRQLMEAVQGEDSPMATGVGGFSVDNFFIGACRIIKLFPLDAVESFVPLGLQYATNKEYSEDDAKAEFDIVKGKEGIIVANRSNLARGHSLLDVSQARVQGDLDRHTAELETGKNNFKIFRAAKNAAIEETKANLATIFRKRNTLLGLGKVLKETYDVVLSQKQALEACRTHVLETTEPKTARDLIEEITGISLEQLKAMSNERKKKHVVFLKNLGVHKNPFFSSNPLCSRGFSVGSGSDEETSCRLAFLSLVDIADIAQAFLPSVVEKVLYSTFQYPEEMYIPEEIRITLFGSQDNGFGGGESQAEGDDGDGQTEGGDGDGEIQSNGGDALPDLVDDETHIMALEMIRAFPHWSREQVTAAVKGVHGDKFDSGAFWAEHNR